jgi:serine/threonine-protein kinase
MEFLSGSDLATRLTRGPVSVDEAASWVMQAAEGVAEAHALGVVHRDLKPANLFLTHRSDGTPCVKVLDFGISKILDADAPLATDPPRAARPWTPDPSMRSPVSTTTTDPRDVAAAVTDGDDGRPMSLTRSRARIGSPQYMAPEQMRASRAIDARCDGWALGTILYELLAHAPAFDAPSFDELWKSIIQREPRRLGDVRREVPRGLVEVIERCLRKSPADRFADVGELGTALAPFVPGGPESAARIGRILHRPRSPESAAPESLENAPTVSAEHDTAPSPFEGSGAARSRGLAMAGIVAATAITAAAAISASVFLARAARPTSVPAETSAASPAASAPLPDAGAESELAAASFADGPRRPVVVVLAPRDVAGRVDAAWIGTAAAEMLVTDLSGASGARVLSPDRVARAVRDLGLDRVDVAAPDLLARVKSALGADYVVAGTYAVLAGAHKIRFDLALLDTKDGSARARAGATGAQGELFDLIDHASTDLRVALGGAAPTQQEVGEARAASPSSPEATRLYAQGIALSRAGNAVDALPVLEQAERLAPDSPFVAYQHGLALRKLGRDNDSVPVLKKAFDLRGPISREYQLQIEALYREATHDWAASADCYRTLFGFFPDSVEYGLSYARALANSGRPKDAWAPLDAVRKRASEADIGKVEQLCSVVAAREGDNAKRETCARAAVAWADKNGLSSNQLEPHMQLGQTLRGKGDYDGALAEFEQVRALATTLGDESFVAGALVATAEIYTDKGDFARALPVFDDALVRARRVGDLYRTAGILNTRAIARYTVGDLEGSRVDWLESARQYEVIQDHEGVGHTTGNVAQVYEDEGDLERAHANHEKALAIFTEIGMRPAVGQEVANLAELELQRGDVAAAARWQQQFDAVVLDVKRKIFEGLGGWLDGTVEREKDDLEAAATAAEHGRALHEEMGAQPYTTDDKLLLAEIALDRGDAALAETTGAAAAEWYRANAVAGTEPVAHALVARALAAQGKTADALAAGDRAMASATKTGRIVAKLEAARGKAVALGAAGQVGSALVLLDGALRDARAKGFVWEELLLRLARVTLRGSDAERAALASDARARGFARIARIAAGK